jgi:hypothetical protein
MVFFNMKQIVLLAIIAVFLISCTAEQSPLPMQKLPESLSQGTVSIDIVSSRPTLESCSAINNSNERDACYNDALRYSKDSVLCENMIDYSLKVQCYQLVAKARKEPEVCVAIKTDYLRDQCYKGVAEIINDAEICKGIIFPELKDECHFTIAVAIKDAFICKSIGDETQKNNCINATRTR